MRLCFGTFAGLMNRCRKKSINQTSFVGRMAWVIDKKTRCLQIISKDDDKTKKEDSIAEEVVKIGLEGNSAVVSKLLACKQNYENRSKKRPDFDDAKKEFSEMVSPMIVDSYKPFIILALIDLIRYDSSINSERSECFERCFGISKGQLFYTSNFEFNDIMTKALLYVTSPEIENIHPDSFSAWSIFSEDGEKIPDIFAPKDLADFLIRNARDQRWYAINWNATSEILQLVDIQSKILLDQMYTLAKREIELFEKKVIEDFNFDSDMRNLNKMIKARLNIKKAEYRGDDHLTIEKMRECLNTYKKLLGELADYVQEFMRLQNVTLNSLPNIPDRRMTQMYKQIEDVYREIDKQLTKL